MAHQAAADFQFWTGVTPMIEPIRDSLEEYMQW
jgi:shikimate 5-dehydrogenase